MTSIKYQYDDLMNPVIQALKQLGGSGTNEEIKHGRRNRKNPSGPIRNFTQPRKGRYDRD